MEWKDSSFAGASEAAKAKHYQVVSDNSTPYYLNLHTGDVAHTLILGMSGSGKSFLRKYELPILLPKQMELSLSA